jgi:hypothetical protein
MRKRVWKIKIAGAMPHVYGDYSLHQRVKQDKKSVSDFVLEFVHLLLEAIPLHHELSTVVGWDE